MPRKKILPTGVRFHGAGYQTNVRVNGKLVPAKSWPMDTPFAVMEDWIKDQKKAGATDGPIAFAKDIASYLEQKSALASINERGDHLYYFAARLGAGRSRFDVTREWLNVEFQTLLKSGKEISTVWNYRASIRAFFNTMDPDRVNPVKRTELPSKPKAAAKGHSMTHIEAAIATMKQNCGARIRATVIAFTGIPPALLKQVTPGDILPNPQAPEYVRCAPREKGDGVEERILPLTDDGAAAFVAFHNANLYGNFATAGVNAQFKKAAAKVGIAKGTICLYHLRHSFLTQMYRVTRDIETVARFAMHAEGSPLTARYAKGAREDVDAAAVRMFNASMLKLRASKAAQAAGQAVADVAQAAPAGIPAHIIEAARQAAAQAAQAAFLAAIEAAQAATPAASPALAEAA